MVVFYMGIIPHNCPHCGTADAAFQVIGARIEPLKGGDRLGNWRVSVGATCPNCSSPIAAILTNVSATGHSSVNQSVTKFLSEPYGPDIPGLSVVNVWPEPPQPVVPMHVPASIERAMLQAERNFTVEGNEEASAMMYRRSLELALKDKFAELSGSLASRIKRLVSDRVLPASMGDWADEIRDLGNDAAHEPEQVDREQLRMIRGFADATLRYLYTLPAEIEARRKLPQE